MPSINFPNKSFNKIVTSSGTSFTSSSTSYVTIHSSGTLTTKGFPVVVGIMGGNMSVYSVSGQGEISYRVVYNGTTPIGEPKTISIDLSGGAVVNKLTTPADFHGIVELAAGSYTFEVQAKLNIGNSFDQSNIILFAYELYHF